MSKRLSWLDGHISISDMDKSTSEIKGVLLIANKTSVPNKLDDCILDVYVISEGIKPLLLHSYTVNINKSIDSISSIEYELSLDGLLLSSIASEVVDLEIKLRGTDIKTYLNINRTEYIDYIETVFTKYGFILSGYSVDIKTKLIAKLFRQYYIYTSNTLNGGDEIKVTYTPYGDYIRVCVYHNGYKSRTNIKYAEIKSTGVIECKIMDIFNEHKISYCETL